MEPITATKGVRDGQKDKTGRKGAFCFGVLAETVAAELTFHITS